ncbi:unnamed protein product [Mytilus edulis]|uniref:Ig-like domain-containing protein n=1 Tax=Mytilus edulis TaxID=6550 RepID=A0A8S3SC54_MYTED|nr:unnamed protein product [Mytilus edulis]
MISLLNGECFYGDVITKCIPGVCLCSKRGLWYSYTYNVVQDVGVVNFKCIMTFNAHGSDSNSISVNIIDFKGPTITTEPGLPVRSGSSVVFTCMVDTLSTKVTFEWECLGKTSFTGPPIIKSDETVTCNNSSVTLSCNIETGLPVYGFNKWIHYFNGTIIRSLNGSVQEMKSILEDETCSYQNAGEYICAAWNKYGDTTLVANKTIVLLVNDMTVYYDLRTVMFCIIAIGIFILSTAGTVIMSKGIRRKNVIHIIGPHERCPTIPIYHTAPALDNTQNEYAIPETGYLQVTNEQYELDFSQDTENKGSENYTSRYMSSIMMKSMFENSNVHELMEVSFIQKWLRYTFVAAVDKRLAEPPLLADQANRQEKETTYK